MYKKTSIMKMKTFLKTNALAIMALLFAGSIMSFKIAEDKAADQNFYYISEDMSEGAFHDVNNWTTANRKHRMCTTGERPCKVVVSDGNTLSSVLGTKTNAQVLDISIQRKLEP
jgi:hypothetical protein